MRAVTIGDVVMQLSDDQVANLREQLSVEVVSAGNDLLTTAQAAVRLGSSEDYVRDHAVELGGRKMGNGPKARWRFDPAKLSTGVSGDTPVRDRTPARRRAPRRAVSGQLLKSRG